MIDDDKKILENILKDDTSLDNTENIDFNSMDIEDLLNEDTFKENSNNNNLNFLNENVKEIQKLYNDNSDIETIKNSDIVLENLLKNSPENKKTMIEKNKFDFDKFKSPIEFINYMETFYVKNQIEENDQVFQLKNYDLFFKKKKKKEKIIITKKKKKKMREKIDFIYFK